MKIGGRKMRGKGDENKGAREQKNEKDRRGK